MHRQDTPVHLEEWWSSPHCSDPDWGTQQHEINIEDKVGAPDGALALKMMCGMICVVVRK